VRGKRLRRVSIYGAVGICFVLAPFLVGAELAAHAAVANNATTTHVQAAYPPAGSSAACDQVSSTTVTVSESITVTGTAASGTSCFDGGTNVAIHFRQSDHIIATVQTDSKGNYTATGNVPSTAHAGAAAVEAVGTLNGATQTYSTAVTVGSSSSANLPKTGRDIALMVMWGVALVAAGTFIIRVVRRRKQHSAV